LKPITVLWKSSRDILPICGKYLLLVVFDYVVVQQSIPLISYNSAKIKGNLNKNHEAMSQYLEKLGQVLSSDEEKKACADGSSILLKLSITHHLIY
jgi:hypothetical protein